VPQPAAPPTPSAGASGQSGGGLLQGQDVRISAVEDTNSLLISATAPQYDIIKSAIRRLDVEPLQVKIDARILEVTLSDTLRFGVQWFLENAISGARGGTGAQLGDTNPNANLRSFSGLGGVVNAGGGTYTFNGPNAQAIVNLLNSHTNSTTLSSPSLMVLNNKSANINVGQQISVQTSVINTGVVGATSQSIAQYISTGLSLSITPRVNPGGLVYLEIEQEQSVPTGEPTESNPNVPISQKLISTEVAVQSGQTILLGGLISEVDSKGSSGLPGLSRLPMVGGLFGSKSRSNTRTETLVLITPTVVYGGADAMREVTDEYVREFKGLQPLIKAGVIPPAPISAEKKAP
jgi:general secretion pathway protein D